MDHTSDQYKAVVQAIEYMKRNLDKEITSEELASLVGYSHYHFSRIFKEITGVSPRHYLSALRIESAKQILVNRSSSTMLHTLLSVGFRSMGTFSSRFKQYVGLSPKQFQVNVKPLHQFINQQENNIKPLEDSRPSPVLTCYIEFPESFKGLIFVGLFPRPIPDQKPLQGIVLNHHQSKCLFSNIPTGTYYVLAATLPISFNPRDYFLLDRVLRGKYEYPIKVTDCTNTEIRITLREPLPTDPPILVNLPQLLFEQKKDKAN
ncbi:helix-turn-helix domain-containing protein [Lentibacillus sediminis]|uniref:helix-turn-helix domain-containing protein n=1 Tax=Lentibacillus sediminis TaxID=1940529 RepID=UPI001EFE19B6|nr:AraC family transcriptional regulator [Lentibacillus sediminis]